MAKLPYKTRALIWIGTSKDDLSAFPRPVKRVMGAALRLIQNGETPLIARPLTGIGSGVFELRDRHDGEAYRTVYLIKLRKGIYVLDAFHKKSKLGKAMPREIVGRIRERLVRARKLDEE